MRRPWILSAAGVVLVGSATALGLILFRSNGVFELALPELTIWSFVVGPMTAAFLGLLLVEMRASSVKGRTRSFLFGLFGTMCGLIVSTVLGVFSIEEVCVGGGIDYDYCGWSVLGVVLRSFWPSFGLMAAVGVILGAGGGIAAAWLTRGSRASMPKMRTRNLVIGLALLVATTATILALSMQPSEDWIDSATLATVFISKRDIHRSQALDPLIENGVIIEVKVPRAALVVGALTDIRQLQGSTAISRIRENEQISANNVMQLDAPA